MSDISDHFPICHFTHNKEKQANPAFVRTQNFNAEKVGAFKEQLSRVDWNSVLNQVDTQSAYDNFYGIFNRLYTHHFPIKNIRFDKNIHNIEPFMSKSILKSRKTKFELAEIKIRFPTEINVSKYINIENVMIRLLGLQKNYISSNLLSKIRIILEKHGISSERQLERKMIKLL